MNNTPWSNRPVNRVLFATLLLAFLLSTSAASAQDTESRQIAVIVSSVGSDAQRDRLAYQAAVLAAEQLRDSSDGIEASDGTRYTLDIRQYTATSADDAADAVDEALDDGADLIIAPLNASFRDTVIDNAEGVTVLYYAEDDTAPTVALKLAPALRTQIVAAADYLTTIRAFTDIAVVNADTTAADAGADSFATEIGADALAVRLTHEADQTDFASDARSIRDAGAQAAFVYTLEAPAAALVSALDEVGWDGVIVTVNPPRNADGLYAPVVWTAAADDAASREFVSDYIARWDENPADESAAYFDAIYLAAQALRDAEALTRTALTGAEYTGVQGVYVNGVPNTVRLIELGNGAGNLEAARYADDVCTTCPSFFVADVTEEEASREAIYTFALIADTEADSGRAIEQAVELAVREINNAGGILGPQTVRYTLRLRTYEAGTPAEAAAAFGQAVQDGAQAVLGGDLNGWVLPAPFAADAAAVPYLVTATGLTSPTLAAARFLYQARANDLTQARAAVTYAVETLELTQFASVSARADYGLNAARAVRDAVRAADDGEIVLSLEHAPDQTDLSGLAAQIAAQSVEVVYAWTTPAAAQSLIDSLAAAGWQGTVFYGYLNDSLAATLTVPDGIALHGVVPWSVSALDWSSRTFAANYTDLYGEAPNDLGAAYYDSVHLLRRAVEAVGPQPLTVATWLREDADFIGVQGVYTPAQYATNELTQAVRVVRVNGGLLVDAARYSACTDLCE
jgi:branched-chain amino acid transport system substrate-binding protein